MWSVVVKVCTQYYLLVLETTAAAWPLRLPYNKLVAVVQ